jgi:predicted Zn-dependent protease
LGSIAEIEILAGFLHRTLQSNREEPARGVIPHSLFGLALAVFGCIGHSAFAAEPPLQIGGFFFGPQEMFDRIFGPERKEDKQALARIKVSPQEEQRMGRSAVDSYLAHLKAQRIAVVNRGKDVEYLRRLVERIRPSMKNPRRYPRITVYVAQSPRCDARSFPGGTLVFFRGFLETAGNEAAVVGIVGHELSHLDRGHHLWRIRRIKLAEKTFSGGPEGFSPKRFFSAGTTMMRIWMQPFRPEFEAEADEDGARWAYLAGYDPRETARLFLDLHRRGKNVQQFMPDFLQSHPAPQDRHQAIMKLHDALQQQNPQPKLYVGRENLRRRVTRFQQEFPE